MQGVSRGRRRGLCWFLEGSRCPCAAGEGDPGSRPARPWASHFSFLRLSALGRISKLKTKTTTTKKKSQKTNENPL